MSVVLVFALFLFELLVISISFCNGSSDHMGCLENEREALLRFKQDLQDPSNRLASWNIGGDCCAWAGIVCDNVTGHIIELNLRNPFTYYQRSRYKANPRSMLVGKVNPSLLDLNHLSYLGLSFNDFQGVQIPRFIGSIRNLRYLNLSDTQFVGMIPPPLGNLSNLKSLDLSLNYLYVENFLWLSGLSFLEQLDLCYVNLSKASDWLLVANTLPSLVELRLSNCQLHHLPPLTISNFSSLTVLDLSFDQFDNSLIPGWCCGPPKLLAQLPTISGWRAQDKAKSASLARFRKVLGNSNTFELLVEKIKTYLATFGKGCLSAARVCCAKHSSRDIGLSYNSLERRIPRSMASLCNLRTIYLSGAKLSQEISDIFDIFSGCVSKELEILVLQSSSISGHLTEQIGHFKNLDTLDLGNYSIVGLVPLSLNELSKLRILHLPDNKLNGTLSEIHFVNLTKLSVFSVNENNLTLKVNHDWVPPFQLVQLGLRSCYVGSRFPQWLHSQKLYKF
ncbi:hypothetical protein WN944_001968 [Citrus x changshan-huyou]|uniref:Leucine-rich repeat-containing N-terminal plant-type domain-containing protein n=1 Tax=Citrus x changshan-huyou TaxID=2935761 RepID=A0AAP0MLY4_9ROSI